MSKQIAVRLPDDLVAFLDQVIADGAAGSRAELVHHALERERRRIIAERDIELLTRSAEKPDDLDDLAAYAARTPMDDID